MSDIVFMDTETLGLDIDSPIWEFAAIRRRTLEDGSHKEHELHIQIHHYAKPWLEGSQALPAEFADDYRKRFTAGEAYGKSGAAEVIAGFMAGRPHIVGAVPDFDTSRIRHQLLAPARIPDPWHYHLIDIENVVVGYLVGVGKQAVNDGILPELDMSLVSPPWSSDDLSRAVGVNPEDFERHTAMGDVRWVMAQWDAVMGGPR
jgi:hypothetical protein